MRISTAQFFDASAANYQRTYANVVKSGNEVSSQTKLNTASDDPVGAARVLQLQQMGSILTQYSSNAAAVNTSVTQNESVFNAIGTAIQRAQELVLRSGSGSLSDKDRLANSEELQQIQSSILGLMNSKDADGSYLFSGSKSTTPPYVANPDGTYTYQGDQTLMNVDIGDGISVASNTTGWDAFEKAVNTARTSTTLTAPVDANGVPADDGVIKLSGGNVSSSAAYNAKFAAGAPYSVTFQSSTQYKITDTAGNDVTAEASSGGVFSSASGAGQSISFRGLDMTFNINLTDAQRADPALADTAVTGHSYKLDVTPSTISTARLPGNPSTTVITANSITDQKAFNENFPSGGAILKFTSATEFDLYAAPYEASSKPVASGVVDANNVAKAAGVSFTLSGTPSDKDQFSAQPSSQQTQNVLNTLSSIITALNTPIDGDTAATQQFQITLSAAIGNLKSANETMISAQAEGGARAAAATAQQVTTQSQIDNSTLESQGITSYDPSEAITRLTLQKSMLEASQLVFTQISSLNLFSKLG